MIDSLTDRAKTFLTHTRRAAVPLAELAGHLRQDPESLVRQIAHDPRFVLIQPAFSPDLAPLNAGERDAYAAALDAVGIHITPSVALADPTALATGGTVELLLRSSVARLLAETREPALAAAAERTRAALDAALTATEPPEPTSAGTAPSTTPPPDPSESARVPPRRRIPSPPPPPYRGSRRR